VSVIVGINAYHGDSAACVVVDGKLVAAVEEERFRRIKHWAGFPSESIAYCLREASVSLSDVDLIAVNSDSKASRWKRLAFLIKQRPDFAYVLDKVKTRLSRASMEEPLLRAFPGESFRGSFEHIEHHLCHLASAYYLSPWQRAVVMSVDGFGDFASAAWGVGEDNRLNVEGRVYFPHSLGIFYETMTQYLGFPNYGDEYKVMGLAPYGKPTYADQVGKLVNLLPDGSFELDLSYFRHATERIVFRWDGGSPTKEGRMFTPALEALLGPTREPGAPLEDKHRDLARSIQVVYERAFFHMLRAAHRRHGLDYVAISGGCGFNSVANGKITTNTPFKQAYVQSAAGDAGGAVGAALHAYYQRTHAGAHPHVNHAYLGPAFSDAEIQDVLRAHNAELETEDCVVTKLDDLKVLYQKTAQAIADGEVIGWFQGRMEWGPRALGNRSILGDPRRADMKDILNLKIKRRESFRPFAPSILREHVKEWFTLDDEVPFMMKVFPIREEKRAQIPAVTHVDGSGRLQTVYRDTNERYYGLIEAFHALTGVPMVLNTSFNENEPVVCKPAEALQCFLRTKMDVLVLGNWFVRRRSTKNA
jgi:carbamoyltransferase